MPLVQYTRNGLISLGSLTIPTFGRVDKSWDNLFCLFAILLCTMHELMYTVTFQSNCIKGQLLCTIHPLFHSSYRSCRKQGSGKGSTHIQLSDHEEDLFAYKLVQLTLASAVNMRNSLLDANESTQIQNQIGTKGDSVGVSKRFQEKKLKNRYDLNLRMQNVEQWWQKSQNNKE